MICLLIGIGSERIILTAIAMWDYNRINKQKEALCAREGITQDREDEFRDMGDDSPLFRYVPEFMCGGYRLTRGYSIVMPYDLTFPVGLIAFSPFLYE